MYVYIYEPKLLSDVSDFFAKERFPSFCIQSLADAFPSALCREYACFLIVLDVVVKGKISDRCALAQLFSALASLTYH